MHPCLTFWKAASLPWGGFLRSGSKNNFSVRNSFLRGHEIYWYKNNYLGNENAIKYIKSLPKRSKQSWEKLFPNIKPTAADLLSKMLTFNPDKRYTVEECLAHSYFDGLHDE